MAAFVIAALEIIEITETRAASNPVTEREAYRELALRMELNYDTNTSRIQLLLSCFRLAIVFLVCEVGAWILVLSRGHP